MLNRYSGIQKKRVVNCNFELRRKTDNTYCYDDEVQPTPGVREVVLVAKRKPLDEHFNEKHNGEHFVHIIQHHF